MEYTFCDNVFSDLHKDVYGFRPRNHPYDNASDEDKQIIWDNLCAELELNEKNARAAEQEAVEEHRQDFHVEKRCTGVGPRLQIEILIRVIKRILSLLHYDVPHNV